MVLFYLTNSFLDISSGVLWWITKNTASLLYNGVSYAISYKEDTNISETNIEINNNYDDLSKDDLTELLQLKNDIKDIKMILVQNNKIK
jgi:hypothetical protein